MNGRLITELESMTSLRNGSKVAFISGHRDITGEEFKTSYVPVIKEYFRKGYSFVIGDCNGCDNFAAQLIALIMSASPDRRVTLTIYHMLQEPRFRVGERHDDGVWRIEPLLADKSVDEWPEVRYIGGFRTDEERDAAMTAASSVDIAFVRDQTKWKSGTAQNLYRRHLMKNA